MNITIFKELRLDIDEQILARHLAHTGDDTQAEFLISLAKQTATFDWCLQCAYISGRLKEHNEREPVIRMLETLLGHITYEATNDL